MSNQKITSNIPGVSSVNPVIIANDAKSVIAFIVHVFGGTHNEHVDTYDRDGTLLHSEVKVDDTIFIVGDRKEDWLFTPAFVQVYVADVESTLKRAVELGGKIITEPTDFVGVKFSRVQDTQGNIWWIWAMLEDYDWNAAFGDDNEDEEWKPTAEANHVHETLMQAMRNLAKDK